MAIRNANLGGTDWTSEALLSQDLNDTFNAVLGVVETKSTDFDAYPGKHYVIEDNLTATIKAENFGVGSFVKFTNTGTDGFTISGDGNVKFVYSNSFGRSISISYLLAHVNLIYIGNGLTSPSPWDVSTFSYDNKSFDFSSQATNVNSISFNSDGTKMYLIDVDTDSVYQYSLSTAWDASTATYDNKSFDVSGQDGAMAGMYFKPDGTKMYLIGQSNDKVYQYSLSTAWDISTASYDNVSFDISGQDTDPQGVFFKDDGTKMYIVGWSNKVHQYSLSTAWDISTASYDNINFSVSDQDGYPCEVYFKPDGTKMYVITSNNNYIYQYSLSTAWDISTASYDNKSLDVSGQETAARGLFFNTEGDLLHIVGSGSDKVFRYNIPITKSDDVFVLTSKPDGVTIS